jgi:hypothetical protein
LAGLTPVSQFRHRILGPSRKVLDGYADDFELTVSTAGDQVLVTNSYGIDAIHAKGMVALPTAGMIILAAKEVVGQGFNGIAGYVHPAMRDKGRLFLFPGLMLAVTLVIFLMKRSVAEKGARIGGE